ncbi:hypothetical protein ES705_28572 [subsurface metagenome]
MCSAVKFEDISISLENSTVPHGEQRKRFSEVIRRLTGNKGRLMEIIDLYPELSEVSEYEESVKGLRKQIDEELKLRA